MVAAAEAAEAAAEAAVAVAPSADVRLHQIIPDGPAVAIGPDPYHRLPRPGPPEPPLHFFGLARLGGVGGGGARGRGVGWWWWMILIGGVSARAHDR